MNEPDIDGWYPDPDDLSLYRFWNGHAWTDEHLARKMAAEPQFPTEAGWFADPKQMNELRYFDGSVWTQHVSNNGVPGLDAIVEETVAALGPVVEVPAKPTLGLRFGIETFTVVYLDEVHPAAKGIAPGDTVTAINGQPVANWAELKAVLGSIDNITSVDWIRPADTRSTAPKDDGAKATTPPASVTPALWRSPAAKPKSSIAASTGPTSGTSVTNKPLAFGVIAAIALGCVFILIVGAVLLAMRSKGNATYSPSGNSPNSQPQGAVPNYNRPTRRVPSLIGFDLDAAKVITKSAGFQFSFRGCVWSRMVLSQFPEAGTDTTETILSVQCSG